LGVDATAEVNSIGIDDKLLSYARGQSTDVVLSLADGAYILFPLKNLRRAYARDAVHVVTLADGRELRGNLIGIVSTPDGKSYDLRGAASVVLLSLPKETPTPEPTKPTPTPIPALWQAQFTKPADFAGSVVRPRFIFEYSSSVGYLIGSSTYQTSSRSFYLKVGKEEVLADLNDFDEVSFANPPTGTPVPDTQMKVRAKSGIETVGTLALKAYDSKGDHYGYNWFFVMYSADSEMIIVLKNPVGNLRKVSQ
jgi:hypothetical protein